MTLSLPPAHSDRPPDLSWVMPCYNEEAVVEYTIRRLLHAFDQGGHRIEIVAVDNGSGDTTGHVLERAASADGRVVCHHVPVNEGYGHGILSGLPRCRGAWIGIVAADGQVDAEDAVRLFEAALAARGPVLAKVRRRFRMDGAGRKIISIAYNLFVRLLWPGLRSIDVNGTPKILPREAVEAMELSSRGWFLDPEIMIKAHYLGLRVLEFNVFARMRGTGRSHVRAGTCWEFFRHLLRFRFSPAVGRWRRHARPVSTAALAAALLWPWTGAL